MSHAHDTRQASSSGAATARTATVDPGRSSLTAQLSTATLATSGAVQRKAADPTNGAEAPAAGKAAGKDGGKDGGKDALGKGAAAASGQD